MTTTLSAPSSIASWLGNEAESLLTYKAKVPQSRLHLPGPDFILVRPNRAVKFRKSARRLLALTSWGW
jgi:class I fructose-bisphosphate aldolase